jgi:hypothetical protein
VHDDLAELCCLRPFLGVVDRVLFVVKERSRRAAAFRFDTPYAVTGG